MTAVPNYPERRIHEAYRGRYRFSEQRGDVAVERTWLRVRPQERFHDKVLYELSFAAFSAPQAVRGLVGADAVVCVIPSLAAAVIAASVVRALRSLRRAPRLVLWFQDLVLLAAPALGSRAGALVRPLLRAAGVAERQAASAADRIVVCSPGFRRYLEGRGVESSRIVTIYNWVHDDAVGSLPPPPPSNATRFLYAGNLGYTQGFETITAAARLLESPIEIDLVGEGNAAEHVRALASGLPNVTVRPPVPQGEFAALLASADGHLVVQRRVGAGANFPSKIASYLASGRPIIASLSPDTAAAETLRASGAAVLVPPESPERLAEAMEALHRQPSLRAELGRRGRMFASERFHRIGALDELERAIVG